MTTSDKKPRRTIKIAKTAKTTEAAPSSSAIPTLSDPVGTSGGRAPSHGGTSIANVAPPVKPAGAPASAAHRTSPSSTRADETRRIKAINVSVTSRHHEDRHASIALAAYFLSESRGFEPGHEVEDWLAAEEQVDQRLLGEGCAS